MSSSRKPNDVAENGAPPVAKPAVPTENSGEIRQETPTLLGSLSQSFNSFFTRTASLTSLSPRSKTDKEEKNRLIEERDGKVPTEQPSLISRVFGGQ